MNKKDISEIKRRFNPKFNNITCIRGCYVNSQGQAISTFVTDITAMPEEEAEKYLAIFKRTLSGESGQNLLPIDFRPEQVMHDEQHKLLTALRDTALRDDDVANEFFEHVMTGYHAEGNYLILLMHDGYDVPYHGKDGRKDAERSDEIFHYCLCSICPVKLTKPALSYYAAENEFHSRESDWVVGAPDLGFMFPAFDERAANIYSALYYTHDITQNHEDFVEAVFNASLSMPAAEQKEIFQSILEDTLQNECSYDVVQTVHEQVRGMMEEQKKDKEAAPLKIGLKEVKDALEYCGVSQEKVAAFEHKYDEEFGKHVCLDAVNVITPKQFELKTANVSIRVAPEHSELVQTRVIDGLNYILIRADEGVEVNGVNVKIAGDEAGDDSGLSAPYNP